MIWYQKYTVEQINQWCEKTMVEFLEITIDKIEDQALMGSMPVQAKVKQPYGIVHGGANCVLAETLGSLAANMTLDRDQFHAVGLSINTSHIKAVRNGKVTGKASLVHKGKSTQVWEVKTFNEANQLTSTTNLTMAIIERMGK